VDRGARFPGVHVARETEFCVMVPDICWSSVWNTFNVALLGIRILCWLPDFFKTCSSDYQYKLAHELPYEGNRTFYTFCTGYWDKLPCLKYWILNQNKFDIIQASKEISCVIPEKEVPDLKHGSNPCVCRVCMHARTPQFVSSVREMFAQFVEFLAAAR